MRFWRGCSGGCWRAMPGAGPHARSVARLHGWGAARPSGRKAARLRAGIELHVRELHPISNGGGVTCDLKEDVSRHHCCAVPELHVPLTSPPHRPPTPLISSPRPRPGLCLSFQAVRTAASFHLITSCCLPGFVVRFALVPLLLFAWSIPQHLPAAHPPPDGLISIC